MNTITFDTLHFANRLKSVGFTDEQAQVITELQRTATDNTLDYWRRLSANYSIIGVLLKIAHLI